MSNDITARSGAVVGQWDGKDAEALKQELARIKRERPEEEVRPEGVPHQDQFPDDLKNFTPYILWACDAAEVCLVGSGANRTESVASIREFYANQVAKDAMARHDAK